MAVRQKAGVLRSLVDGNFTCWSVKSICFRSSGGFRLFSSLFLVHIPIAHIFVTFAERDSRRAAAPSQIWEPRWRGAVCFLWLHTWKPQTEPERNGMKGSSLWERGEEKKKNSEEEKAGGERDIGESISGWVFGLGQPGCASWASLCTPAAYTWGVGLLLVAKMELETVTPTYTPSLPPPQKKSEVETFCCSQNQCQVLFCLWGKTGSVVSLQWKPRGFRAQMLFINNLSCL